MKIRFRDEFKEDYLRVSKSVNEPKKFDQELSKVVRMLQEGQKPEGYITNTITYYGSKWEECFVYDDAKHVVILQYKIQGQRVYLANVGTPSFLTKKLKATAKKPRSR